MEKRTGLKGKSFEKIKFAVVRRQQYSKPQYLNDGMCPQNSRVVKSEILTAFTDDILWDVAANEDDYLGLDHVDRTRTIRNGAGDLFLKG